jgi:hypothetical protein
LADLAAKFVSAEIILYWESALVIIASELLGKFFLIPATKYFL